MSKLQFASQVNMEKDLSKPVTQHYLPKGKESTFAKPNHMIASSSSRNSSKNMPRVSSNDMFHNHYLEKAKKRTQERNKNSKSSCHSGFTNDEIAMTIEQYGSNDHNVNKSSFSNMIVMTLMIELESLFGHLFDEYSSGENQVVSKSFAVTTVDSSDKRQQQPDSTSSTSTLATTDNADENFDL
nr:hypothetical protein [Tanacetum cinerariifolium]